MIDPREKEKVLRAWLKDEGMFEEYGGKFPLVVQGSRYSDLIEATLAAAKKLELNNAEEAQALFDRVKKSATDPSSGTINESVLQEKLLDRDGEFHNFLRRHPACTFYGVSAEVESVGLVSEDGMAEKRTRIRKNMEAQRDHLNPHPQ